MLGSWGKMYHVEGPLFTTSSHAKDNANTCVVYLTFSAFVYLSKVLCHFTKPIYKSSFNLDLSVVSELTIRKNTKG
jgi:hypothetical protein